MKRLCILACVLWLLAPVPCQAQFRLVPYDPATMSFPVTPEQAVATARQWASDPSLSLELRGVEQDPNLFQADYYILASPDGQRFRVSCHGKGVSRWFSIPATQALRDRRSQDAISPLPRVPLAEQEQIALGWASAHYPNFNELNMQMGVSEDGYVSFATRIAGGHFCIRSIARGAAG